MGADGLAAVREHVVASSELATRLAAIAADDELLVAVLDLAVALGVEVTPADLDDALRDGKRRSLERWR